MADDRVLVADKVSVGCSTTIAVRYNHNRSAISSIEIFLFSSQ